ncbi:MAG: bifunctional 5,10-methylenetetrahydrofolate dehydrogenase/5,10-methenyltetrahydrofolate cyclohydrolase [Bacteroidales bacterium]|nr:bifunctional 5,10-methylenetetrahydrofolate dehydrogenase/5,10-methenyltetrahydrofolate cyclohydrolase [Candidatus Cacconaster caballi]
MILLDGKKTSDEIKLSIKAEVDEMIAKGQRRPKLAAVLVGNDGASCTYVANKHKACIEAGIESIVHHLPEDVSMEELLKLVAELNADDTVDGFIVQLPLPKHLDEQAVTIAINPDKDVDGFHPVNTANASMGLPCFVSATPQGVLALLGHYGIDTRGKNCVIIGRSNIVGRPLANLLSSKNYDCTVTLCHSRTGDVASFTRQADIVIAAVGIPHFVKADMVKEGAVVVDVGITRVKDSSERGYHIEGDVDFDNVAPKCSYISPVPGGVGKMTIISLLMNTVKAAKNR